MDVKTKLGMFRLVALISSYDAEQFKKDIQIDPMYSDEKKAIIEVTLSGEILKLLKEVMPHGSNLHQG